MDIDWLAVENLELDTSLVDIAIEAATEATAAGDDDQGSLIFGIKAYLWAQGIRNEH